MLQQSKLPLRCKSFSIYEITTFRVTTSCMCIAFIENLIAISLITMTLAAENKTTWTSRLIYRCGVD